MYGPKHHASKASEPRLKEAEQMPLFSRKDPPMYLQADSMDEVQRQLLQSIVKTGCRVKPRGQWAQEITGACFQLLEPRARLIYSPIRVYTITFALGELLWYLRGSNQAHIVSFYNPRYKTYSDDGNTLHGAYGKRLFSSDCTGI